MPSHVVVDASVWVSEYVPQDGNHAASRSWLNRYLTGGGSISVPMLVLSEVAGAVTRRTGSAPDASQAVGQLLRLVDVNLLSVDEPLAKLAAYCALTLRLRGADAVYVALAWQLGVPLITWDSEQLQRTGGHITPYTPATHPI